MACCCGLNRQARHPQLHPIDDPLTYFHGLKKTIHGVDIELTGFFVPVEQRDWITGSDSMMADIGHRHWIAIKIVLELLAPPAEIVTGT